MDHLESTDRWVIGILLTLALLTFFFPLISLQLPFVGPQSWSGYDIVSRMDGLEKQLSTFRGDKVDSSPQDTENLSTPKPSSSAPVSIQMLVFVPLEIAIAFICAAVAFLCCLCAAKGSSVKAFSLIGAISGGLAILHLTIANSDAHAWLQESLKGSSNGKDNDFLSGIEKLTGLLVNSIQLSPGAGLFALVAALVLAILFVFLRRPSAAALADFDELPQDESRKTLGIAFALVAVVIAAAVFYHVATQENFNQHSTSSAQRPGGRKLASEEKNSFSWPLVGLPMNISAALETPDIAPPPGRSVEIELGVLGEKQLVSTDTESTATCGSIGCGWDVEQIVPRRTLLGGGYGVLHKAKSATGGFYDLLVENKQTLQFYQFDGQQYRNTKCYVREESGNAVMPEAC